MPVLFRPRLRLAPLVPAMGAVLVLATTALAVLPNLLADQAALELEQTLVVLEPLLPAPRATTAAPDPELQAILVRSVAGTDYRLTLIRPDGVVVADSARTLDEVARMENHASREEVASALERGEGRSARRSATTGLETSYAARLVVGAPGVSWVIRLARPARTLAALRTNLRRVVLGATVVAIGIALLVAAWLSRHFFRPLDDLIEAADGLADGERRVKVHVPEQEELAVLGRALHRLGVERRQQHDAVEAERDHLRATVASMSEGVLVTGPDGTPRIVNPAFRKLFGVTTEAIASEVLDLIRDGRLFDLVRSVRQRGEPATIEVERLEPEPRRLALVASPLAGDGGVVVLARDLTESERIHQIRRDFVANVSHELKTPLAAIRGYAETLVDGAVEDPATALRMSERILAQSRRLGDLLEDLLTLSRLERTETPPVAERVDLRELAEEAVELVATPASAKSIVVTLAEGPATELDGDPDALLRMLSNLLDNAVKYTPAGGRVDVRLERGDGEVRIEVRDTGIGIPAAQVSRIFERFYRVDKGRAREEGGTGLGLAIVKHVAQSHGGRVEVESDLGRGSLFRVLLPSST